MNTTNITFPRCPRFAIRMFSIPVLTGFLVTMWVNAANAAPVPPEYRVPGHCVKITQVNDDGSVISSLSCEFSGKDYACIKATGKICKR